VRGGFPGLICRIESGPNTRGRSGHGPKFSRPGRVGQTDAKLFPLWRPPLRSRRIRTEPRPSPPRHWNVLQPDPPPDAPSPTLSFVHRGIKKGAHRRLAPFQGGSPTETWECGG